MDRLAGRIDVGMADGSRMESSGSLVNVFKVAPAALWAEAERQGVFEGAPVDHADGFIHFSTAAQLAATLDKHFRGQADLVLVAVNAAMLGPALRWEPARGGDLFPHLYGPLPLDKVLWTRSLPLDPKTGRHVLPDGLGAG